MPLTSPDAVVNKNGITLLKGHVAAHFDYLDLKNTILPLTTLLASCDTNIK